MPNNQEQNLTSPDHDTFYAADFAIVPGWVYKRLARDSEALNFYVWLCLFVTGKEHQGYKRLSEIAAALEVSERTVKRRVQTLRDAGVVEVRRYNRKNGLLGQNVYYLPKDDPDLVVRPPDDGEEYEDTPLPKFDTRPRKYRQSRQEQRGVTAGDPTLGAAKAGERGVIAGGPSGGVIAGGPSINPDTPSTQTAEPLRGSPAPAAPDAAAQPPLIPDEVLDGEVMDDRNLPAVPEPAGAVAVNAGVLTREWVDWCAGRGVKLPTREIKRYAKEFKEAIDQGFPEMIIRTALNHMARDRVLSRPALFPTYLVRVQTGPELPPARLSQVDAASERRAAMVGMTSGQVMQELVDEFDWETGRFKR